MLEAQWLGLAAPAAGIVYRTPHNESFTVPRTLHNELVLSAECWRRHLPSLVRAFFVPHDAAPEKVALAVETRDEFLRTFRLRASAAPLVSYDARSPEAPFSPFQGPARSQSVAL